MCVPSATSTVGASPAGSGWSSSQAVSPLGRVEPERDRAGGRDGDLALDDRRPSPRSRRRGRSSGKAPATMRVGREPLAGVGLEDVRRCPRAPVFRTRQRWMVGVGPDRVGAGLAQLGEEPDEVDELGAGQQVRQPLGHQRAALLAVLDRGDRDDPLLAGGVLEDEPLVVLLDHDPLEDPAVVGEDDPGLELLLDRLVGDQDRVDDVIDRRAEAQGAQLRPDPAGGAAEGVALHAVQLGPAEDRLAPVGVPLGGDLGDQGVHLLLGRRLRLGLEPGGLAQDGDERSSDRPRA